MVVEDQADVADTLCLLLKLWGFNFILCRDAFEALKTYPEYLPHVALIDLGLPGMDGIELAGRLRVQAAEPRPMFVAVTGFADDAHRSLAAPHFDHYLVKPAPPEMIKTLLSGRLERLGPE